MNKKVFVILTLLILCPVLVCIGQPPPPPPQEIPLDGGLWLLLAAGISYGIKKLFNNKKTK